MHKVNQMPREQLEQLQSDYGECKIDTNAFIAGITELGYSSPMDIHMLLDEAQEARAMWKLDQAKQKEKK